MAIEVCYYLVTVDCTLPTGTLNGRQAAVALRNIVAGVHQVITGRGFSCGAIFEDNQFLIAQESKDVEVTLKDLVGSKKILLAKTNGPVVLEQE